MPTMSDDDVRTANNYGRKNILVTTSEMLHLAQGDFADPKYRLFENIQVPLTCNIAASRIGFCCSCVSAFSLNGCGVVEFKPEPGSHLHRSFRLPSLSLRPLPTFSVPLALVSYVITPGIRARYERPTYSSYKRYRDLPRTAQK